MKPDRSQGALSNCRMNRIIVFLSFLMGLLVAPLSTTATHLIGGSLSYTYLGDPNNDGFHTYEVTMTTYQDCNSNNWFTNPGGVFPLANVEVGIYEGALQGNNLALTQSLFLPLSDSGLVRPNFPDTCTFGIVDYCVFEVKYSATIDLPVTFSGYHFVYDVCCRPESWPGPPGNPAIGPNNLQNPDAAGSIFHAWTGRTLAGNSSVQFPPLTQPYICLSDTSIVNNNATDIDGNLLTFEFITPYDGFGAGGASPPQPSFDYPVTNLCTYPAGFSFTQPFGPNGFAFIDPTSGASLYQCPTQGIYVLAIRVTERLPNGQIVGVSTREFQYIVAPCQNQQPNDLSLNQLTDSLIFNIDEGDSLCFDVRFDDPDGDTLMLEITGSLFDTILNPPGNFTTPSFSNGIVSSTVCWQTTCNQGRSAPYVVNPTATDFGCPPRSFGAPYQIFVKDFKAPQNILGPTAACPGPVFFYEADSIPGAIYNWTITNGTQVSGGNTHRIGVLWDNGPTLGNVEVTAENKNGCTDGSIDIGVSLKALPPISAGNDTVLCDYDTLTLGVPNGVPQPTLSAAWSQGQFLSNDSVVNPSAFPTTTTNFVLTGYDTDGCFLRDTVTVSVFEDNLDAGADLYLCPGDSVSLTATGADTYLWNNASFLTSGTVANPIAFPNDTTDFILTGTVQGICTFFDTITVEVDTVVPTFLFDTVRFCAGSTVDVGGNPTAPAFSFFKWTPNFNLTSDSIPNPISSTPVDTSYVLEVFNGSCFGYDTVFVKVDSLTTLPLGSDTAICSGVEANFSVANLSNTSYMWTSKNPLSSDTFSTTTARILQNDTLILEVTNGFNCQSRDSILINSLPQPNPNLPEDSLVCFGDTLTLSAGAGTAFAWFPNQFITDSTVGTPGLFPDDTLTYSVLVTDTGGCVGRDTITLNVTYLSVSASNDTLICPGDTLSLFASGGIGYAWSDGTFLSSDTIATPLAYPDETTDFRVSVTDQNNCVGIETVRVEVSRFNFISGGSDQAICYGDSVQISGSGISGFYWTPNLAISDTSIPNPIVYPKDTTTYTITGIDPNNCTNSDSVRILVFPKPPANAGQDRNLCKGDTVIIGTAQSSSFSYEWEPSTALNNAFIPRPVAQPDTQTRYVVKVTAFNGCSWKDTVLVNLFTLSTTPDTFVCVENGFPLDATPRFGNPPYSFEWTPGSGLSDSTIGNPVLSLAEPTTYQVIVVDSANCSDTSTITIGVGQKPTAAFDFSVKPSCDETVLQLEDQSLFANRIKWRVNQDSSDIAYPQFRFPYGETLTIELLVTSTDACTDTLVKTGETLTFEDYAPEEFTNVFTPNGDGVNDWFEFPIDNRLEQCTEISIFNRWGQLVFTSQGVNHSWDGTTFEGQQADPGVYFYVIAINGVEWKGSVTLLR